VRIIATRNSPLAIDRFEHRLPIEAIGSDLDAEPTMEHILETALEI
jgi:hypothetical protein